MFQVTGDFNFVFSLDMTTSESGGEVQPIINHSRSYQALHISPTRHHQLEKLSLDFSVKKILIIFTILGLFKKNKSFTKITQLLFCICCEVSFEYSVDINTILGISLESSKGKQQQSDLDNTYGRY